MKNRTLIIMLVVIVTMGWGCKKFVDVDPPKTEIIVADAFKKDISATSAVLGIYVSMQNDYNFINSGITINAGLAADELVGFYDDPYGSEFLRNTLSPTNPTVNNMWSGAFSNMVNINTCIEGLEASTSLSAPVKAQLLGESKFNRAFVNFYLLNLWGNIPLVTSADYSKSLLLKQSKPDEAYAAIIADLKEAQSLLIESYPTEGRVRPNKWAATALLARVYLYRNDFANAEIQSSAVISSGKYGPLPALNDAFLKESSEAIWQLLTQSNYSGTQEGYSFLSDVKYGSPTYYFTDDLLNSFEAGDNRKASWISTINYDNVDYYYPYKYKDVGEYNGTNISEYYMMLRLSEQYLIRAEARAQLGKQTEALADVNIIRKRAGLGDISLTDKSALLTAIANENRHEFFAEWGHRWLDLKRTGRADAVLPASKPGWKSTAAFFPIPQTEINLNKNLVQNPGY